MCELHTLTNGGQPYPVYLHSNDMSVYMIFLGRVIKAN